MRGLFRKKILLLCVSAFVLGTADPIVAARHPVEKVAAGTSFAEGWILRAEPALFDRDTLFEQINGEAELFFPYGFERLAAAEYENRKNPDVRLAAEVYRMGSPLDAFGIYANYRRPSSIEAPVGVEGFVSATQLMFYQNRYFVRIQVTGAMGLDKEIFLACARVIAENLPREADTPKELAALRLSSVVKKTERYIAKSLLGYAFFRRGLIADAAVGGEKLQIFLISEDSPEAAQKAFDEYRAYLNTEGRGAASGTKPGRNALSGVDPLYGGVFVEQSGSFLIGAVRAGDPVVAQRLIEELYSRLGGI